MALDLTGRPILVTGGPTRADLDAVRFISNRSSGRLGCRIAREALSRGAEVTMVAGPQSAVAVVHAMAVLDYVPEASRAEKTPSGHESWDIRLVRTPKVIRRIKEWAPETFLVEFKLEVGEPEDRLREIALASLRANRADLVVANDLTRIRDETHPALIISPEGQLLARPATKTDIARALCDVLATRLR